MAEIRVEPPRRRSYGWVWLVLLLLVAAAVLYWLYINGMLGMGATGAGDTAVTTSLVPLFIARVAGGRHGTA